MGDLTLIMQIDFTALLTQASVASTGNNLGKEGHIIKPKIAV